MKSILITIMLLMSSTVFAQSYVVNDITKDGLIHFTPGVSLLSGKCSFNWGGLKAWPIEDFFNGSTSYSVDTRSNAPYGDTCLNLTVDVVGGRVNVPYVNQEALAASNTPAQIGVS